EVCAALILFLHHLTRLHLNANSMMAVGPGSFANLPRLEVLDLSDNSLLAFRLGIPKLRHLDLRDNALKKLSNATMLAFAQRTDFSVLLAGNSWVCDCNIEDFVAWLRNSDAIHDKQNLSCISPENLLDVGLLRVNRSELQCPSSGGMERALETSYVFLGMVLALIGLIFLLVLYLNRKGIKRWLYNIRDACRDHMEGYHYRYEINSDPRLANISLNSDV
uniref:Trophoblast glycoprotein n=1 Tax=Scleropages formosus TaxID=113540 RepID=A0A8C9V3G9_SCLFO